MEQNNKSLNSTTGSIEPEKRLKFSIPISYKRNYARQKNKAMLKNISLTGAFINTTQVDQHYPDEKLSLTFHVSGRKREIIAHIIWLDSQGCGIKFRPFNNRDIQIIDDLIFYIKDQNKNQKNILTNIFSIVS